MPKTYTDLSNVTTGSVLTATAYNNHIANTENVIVPPLVQVRRTTNQTGYSGGTAITWESVGIASTDDTMWAASPNPTRVTINSDGIYLVQFTGRASGAATVSLVSAGIMRNGTLVSDSFQPATSNAGNFSISAVLDLSATNYIEAQCNFVGGSAYVVEGAASLTQAQTRLTVCWIGKKSF